MAITISTHNGHSVVVKHNIRDPELVKKENEKWERMHPGELRINPDGPYEIIYHEDLREAYEILFGESVKEWNARQTAKGQKDRCIDDYLEELRAKEGTNKSARHPVYEIIYQVGGKNYPIPDDAAKLIIYEMVEGFQERNPALHVVGIYFHGDEESPHIHLDYIPVAENCSRGMRVQNALKKALKQQGIVGNSRGETAQILWEKKENAVLEAICNKHGYQVVHPERGSKQEHLSVEEYKLSKEIEEKKEEISKMQALPAGFTLLKKSRIDYLEGIENRYISEKKEIEDSLRDIKAAREAIEAYSSSLREIEDMKLNYMNKINEEANRKHESQKQDSMKFIEEMGYKAVFEQWKHESKENMKHRRAY